MAFAEFYHHLRLYPEDWGNFEELLENQLEHERFPKNREKLLPFWENIEFRNFMEKTSVRVLEGSPKAPGPEIVEPLIGAISMVAPDEEKYIENMEKSKISRAVKGKKVTKKKAKRKAKRRAKRK